MPLQNEFDVTYLKMAKIWSSLSKAERKKVGCLVILDRTIISDGYNGTPTGFDNTCENIELDENGKEKIITKKEVLHAESNAITKLAKSSSSCNGATLYTTLSPCVECSKLIIQSGIIRVVYSEAYRDLSGIELLNKAKIKTKLIKY